MKCEDCIGGMNSMNDCALAGPGYGCPAGELRDDIPGKDFKDGKPVHEVTLELYRDVMSPFPS
jgi:hypothetical protein